MNPKNDDLLEYVGSTITEDIVDMRTGEIFLEGGEELTADNIESLRLIDALEIKTLEKLSLQGCQESDYSVILEKNKSQELIMKNLRITKKQ